MDSPSNGRNRNNAGLAGFGGMTGGFGGIGGGMGGGSLLNFFRCFFVFSIANTIQNTYFLYP
jgi:hypothetical protein